MAERDSVFHRYTAFLARRAGGIVVRWTLFGGTLGALLGAVTLTHWAKWPVTHREGFLVAVLGFVCGAFLGRALGSGRAQMVLFQAQLAQHQLEFERKLLAISTAVGAHPQPAQPDEPEPQAVAAPPAPAAPQAPEPEPEPVFLSGPPLAAGAQEFTLPTLPQPEPVFQPEPAALEPQPAPSFALKPLPLPEPSFVPEPGDVVPFAPRPEPVPEGAPAVPASLPAAAFAPVGSPPLSGDVPAAPAPPAAPSAEGDPGGYGWQRPGVIDQ